MRIEFPYPGYKRIESVDVPDENLLGVYAPCAGAERLGLRYAATALERGANVAVLRHGGHIVPVVEGKPAGGSRA